MHWPTKAAVAAAAAAAAAAADVQHRLNDADHFYTCHVTVLDAIAQPIL
jgi:hypothetical protein